MEILYYTGSAILLYLLADWLLDRIEKTFGRRLPYRSLVFFTIIAALALATSQIVMRFIERGG